MPDHHYPLMRYIAPLGSAAMLVLFGFGLHMLDRIIVGLAQCSAWGTCPW